MFCATSFSCVLCSLTQARATFGQTHEDGQDSMEEQSCVLRETDRQGAELVGCWCSYRFWMWGSKVDFEHLDTHPLSPFPVYHLFTPMLIGRLCGTHFETLALIHGGISLPATALRSPNSGVKLPLLVSPLFPMETTPSALRLLSSHKAESGSPALFTLVHLLPLLLQWASFHAIRNHLISNSFSPLTFWGLF